MPDGIGMKGRQDGLGSPRMRRWLTGSLRASTLARENPELAASAFAANLLSLALPILVLQVYDRIIPNNAESTLLLCLLGMAIILILDAFLGIARAYVVGWNAARTQHEMSTTALGRLIGSDTKSFEQNNVGSYIQSLRAVDVLRGFHGGQSMLLSIDVPFAVVFLALIALIGGPVVIAPIAILIGVAFVARWTGIALRDALEERTGNDKRRHSFMIDVLAKIGTAKALGMESLLIRRYERLQGQSAAANYHAVLHSVLARSIGVMMSQIMMVVVAAAGATMVIGGSMSIGALAACTLLAGRIGSPLMRLLAMWTQYQSMAIARRQMKGILAMPQETTPAEDTDQSDDDADENRDPASHPADFQGDIAFEDVTFSYSPHSAPLLANVDLNIAAGSTVAITGPNATGKSSLLQLMAGLLHPDEGRVAIDGDDIEQYPLDLLRRRICYLPQHPVLFEGTILENLTTFRTEERLEQAFAVAEAMGLSDTIARLPEGFDTKIGDGAVDGLPVGLRQRLAVARAFIAVPKPRIILFDEANALFDSQSDEALIQLLRQHKGNATMVLISHRPTILSLADHVLSLQDGTLVAGGPAQLPPPQPQKIAREGAA